MRSCEAASIGPCKEWDGRFYADNTLIFHKFPTSTYRVGEAASWRNDELEDTGARQAGH